MTIVNLKAYPAYCGKCHWAAKKAGIGYDPDPPIWYWYSSLTTHIHWVAGKLVGILRARTQARKETE